MGNAKATAISVSIRRYLQTPRRLKRVRRMELLYCLFEEALTSDQVSAWTGTVVFRPAALQIIPLLGRCPDPAFKDSHQSGGRLQYVLIGRERHVGTKEW